MEPAEDVGLSEYGKVVLHRYREAREYGFTRLEARLYAESDISASELRRLKRAGWPPLWAAKVLL